MTILLVCLLGSATVAYAFAAITYLYYLVRGGGRSAYAGTLALAAGWGLHFAALVVQVHASGLPRLRAGPGAGLLALFIVSGFLLTQLRWRAPVVGAFITPLAVLMNVVALVHPGPATELPPAVRSPWFPIHVSLAFIGEAAFAIAFGVSVTYLWQQALMKRKRLGGLFQRLPDLATLDTVNRRCVNIGLPLLTLAIATGVVYSRQVTGDWWTWDLKSTSGAAIWVVFAGAFVARHTAGWRGRRAALLTVVGFVIALASFLATRVVASGVAPRA
jgi:ABC-type uncharacterized transport system permease subunit